MNIFADVIHTEKHKLPNSKVLIGVIEYDTCATNPRTWDNLGTILVTPNKSHWVAGADEMIDTAVEMGNNPYEHWENICREQLKLLKSEIALAYPIHKHEYGVIGFVYATRKQVCQWYNMKHITQTTLKKAKKCIQSEIDEFLSWLNGDCYGYRVYGVQYDELGDVAEYNTLDSCWGFVGDIDYCRSELQDAIKRILATSKTHASA